MSLYVIMVWSPVIILNEYWMEAWHRRKLRSLSLWERVGVRGYPLSIGRNPSPGSLRDPTSPHGRGGRTRALCLYGSLEAVAFLVSSNNLLGLSGISNNSTPRRCRSSASSIACANSGPTGIAPASPAPLMPIGLSGEVV